MADYINAGAAILSIMRLLAKKGGTVAECVLEIANQVSYAEEHNLDMIYCCDYERGTMYHAAMTYYNFHDVEQVWISGADIEHDEFGDRVGNLKVYRNCEITRNSYCEERDGRRMWKLIRIILKEGKRNIIA